MTSHFLEGKLIPDWLFCKPRRLLELECNLLLSELAGDHLSALKGEYELRCISLGAVTFGGGAPRIKEMPQVALILASHST
jgi:hypothetical protein